MAGRPRKVVEISTGKVGKVKKEARKEQEKKIKLERDQLHAPAWLNDEAAEEFERVVAEAGQIELLDNLDLGILAIYANAWSAYMDIAQKIERTGYTMERESREGPYQVVHPLLSAQEKYAKQIMQCSTKLGLATTDRLKLIVPVKEESETNKFLKYAK